jgi:TatD DNase family protein
VIELVDSHCHLDQPHFASDREAVIARAAESGVTRLINPGVDLPSSRAAVALARRYEGIYAAVGVHPHDAKTLDAAALAELPALAQAYKNVAIGEIGLDYYRDLSLRDAQRRAFQAQLELAAQLGLPVIVHDRDAHADVLALLSSWSVSLHAAHSTLDGKAGVLHSFSGGVALAERAVALGFYIGISGPVTYPGLAARAGKNADQTRDVARAVSLDRLLIETDAPYLTPQPYRGKRNEPAYVRFVAQAVADVRGLTLEQVTARTTANAAVLFGLAG